MAVFYHVSRDLNHNGYFEPRIPQSRHAELEDSSTPRVSVSTTIEGCLTGIPGGAGSFEETNEDNRGYYLIFKIDTELLGIPEEFIKTSSELYQTDCVQDALHTDEHWIMTSFQVSDQSKKTVVIDTWKEEVETEDFYDIPSKVYNLAMSEFDREIETSFDMSEFDREIETAWQKIYGDYSTPPMVSIITNVDENEIDDLNSGDEVSLFYVDDEEKEFLNQQLMKRESILEWEDGINKDIIVTIKQPFNLTDLIQEHWSYVKNTVTNESE